MAYPFRIATQLQYYVKHEKYKVNDVIFPSSCEARGVNLGNKNVKFGIFTGGTSVRSKNIFTDIPRYPTGKHEINCNNVSKLRVLNIINGHWEPQGRHNLDSNRISKHLIVINFPHSFI